VYPVLYPVSIRQKITKKILRTFIYQIHCLDRFIKHPEVGLNLRGNFVSGGRFGTSGILARFRKCAEFIYNP
jgi:hypothetical protein